MKGRELIDNVVRGEMPDIEKVRREVRQAAPRKRAPLRLAAMAAVAAAVVCLLVGSLVWSPQSNNSFSVKAYAMEGEADAPEWVSSWVVTRSGYVYGEIYLKCEGRNITSVEFIAEEGGILAKKDRELANNGNATLFLSTDDSFLLEGDDLAENVILYVGRPRPVDGAYPPVTIRAIATFTDGTTQEKNLVIH